MYKKIILSLVLGACLLPSKASSLSSFARPKKKPIAKAKPKRRTKIKVIKKQENPVLKDAVLIELPAHKSLVREFSPSETQARDQNALAFLLDASAKFNPNIAKAEKTSRRSFNSRSKEEAINLINSVLAQLEQDYQNFKAFYSKRYQRNNALKTSSNKARDSLIAQVGQGAVTELEALIKGGR